PAAYRQEHALRLRVLHELRRQQDPPHDENLERWLGNEGAWLGLTPWPRLSPSPNVACRDIVSRRTPRSTLRRRTGAAVLASNIPTSLLLPVPFPTLLPPARGRAAGMDGRRVGVAPAASSG